MKGVCQHFFKKFFKEFNIFINKFCFNNNRYNYKEVLKSANTQNKIIKGIIPAARRINNRTAVIKKYCLFTYFFYSLKESNTIPIFPAISHNNGL